MDLSTLKLNLDAPISVLIGENGCGKSQVLSEVANSSVDENTTVIAIATSVYDKFPRRNIHRNFHYMGARLGKFIPREAIKQAIIQIDFQRTKDFSSIFNILNYTHYDQKIGFKLSGISPDFENRIKNIETLREHKKETLITAFHAVIKQNFSPEYETLWFDKENNYYDSSEVFMAELLSVEKVLRKHKILKAINIYLSKSQQTFPLASASSGELSLISTLIFISSAIDENTLILIDEPENSLHPKWQKEYFKKIMDLFSYYQPKILSATHSPIIISGLHNEEGVEIHKHTNLGFVIDKMESKNAEDIYSDLFDIITPASRSLSNRCADLLNKFSDNEISLDAAREKVSIYLSKSYDGKQQEFLNGIIELLNQISAKKKTD